ncbi:ABC transporter permease [Paenibacillus sp. MBLB4367]|uniref:ABC transporter permease n=1 Tax=Paenibacillus sp. MBLB4367 TaxID=3384767 RepID=UPI003907EA52
MNNQSLAAEQSALTAAAPQRPRSKGSLIRNRWLYIMLIPGVLYYIVFHYVPMFGVLLAFKDYSLTKGVLASPWVGFKHFHTIFTSYDFFTVLKNTIILSFYRIVFNMIPDVLFAVLLNEVRVRWFKRIVQTVTYGPYFLSWVIVYGLVFSFFAPGSGLVTNWVRDMNWGELNVLTNPDMFRPMLILSEIWKSTGFGAIFYLAAIAGINPETYEAAVVDGAGRWRQMWHVTLPGIRNVFMLLLILNMGSILDAGFDQVYVFLNSLVYNVGDILDTNIFRRGIEQFEFGEPVAMGVFKSIVGLIMITAANNISRKLTDSGVW